MNTDYLKTVGKAVDVLNLFIFAKNTWGPREIARELGINKSSAHRILYTLRERNLLHFDEGISKYTLGTDLMRMAIALQNQNALSRVARKIMRRYADDINETLIMFSYKEGKMVFELAVEVDHALRFNLKLGVPYSLHLGVSGKVVLANIPQHEAELIYRSLEEDQLCDVAALKQKVAQCKKDGYITASSDRVRGVLGFSAPIFDFGDEFIGGITLALPEARYAPENHKKYVGTTVSCAQEISNVLHNTN